MRSLILVAALFCAASSALAVSQNYGSFTGDTVVFGNVTEDSSTDPLPLYGTPTILSDSIAFSPISFQSISAGKNGHDETMGSVAMTITANPGRYLTDIQVQEAGDVTLVGNGNQATNASVTALLQLTVRQIDGVAVTPFQLTEPLVYPTGSEFDLGSNGQLAGIWNGSVNVDVAAWLARSGIAGHATQIDFSMSNDLLTNSQRGTYSLIKKKDIEGSTLSI